MFKSETTLVVFFVLFLPYYSAAHEVCRPRLQHAGNVRTPEECAARCQYSEEYGECAAWDSTVSGSGCRLYYVHRTATSSGRFDHCGVVSHSATNPSPEPSADAPESEPEKPRCIINFHADLGYALTEEACEQSCRELVSNRYSDCVAWLWDDNINECRGYLVQESTTYVCGTP